MPPNSMSTIHESSTENVYQKHSMSTASTTTQNDDDEHKELPEQMRTFSISDKKTPWTSVIVAAALAFCSAIQFSLYFSSTWPFLQTLDPNVTEQFYGLVISAYSFGQIIGESQLLAIGSGFVVFVALVAIFAAIQQRKRRRNSGRDFHSPLIQSFNSNKQRFRATSRNFGSSSSNGGSPPPMLSPSSDSSSSPQCTPMTPYASSFASHAELPIQQQNAENGSLSLAINYDKEAKSLQITVISCHNLPELQMANNSKSTLNPYVKMRVLPDNQHRIKTRVLRNTNNPFFDEQFTIYGVTYEQLKTYTLHLAALASDRFSRDTVLGEAFLNLAEVERRRDFNDNENKDNTIELKLYPRPVYADLQAQIFLSIAYNQLTNSINFAVLKMKDLPCSEQIGQIDAYVKVYMLLNGNRISKHKSHVKRRTNDPVFNESFCFNLPSMVNDGSRFHSPDQILDSISFEVQVLNHNGVTRSEIIGSCMVGGSTSRHWQAVREQPGQQIAEWHRIQS